MHKDWFRRRELTDAPDRLRRAVRARLLPRQHVPSQGARPRPRSSIPAWGWPGFREAIAAEPGKPLLALATHIHVDHVGSLNEFAERAGPAASAPAFAAMDDALTYADMYRVLAEPVSRPPVPDWKVDAYRIRAGAADHAARRRRHRRPRRPAIPRPATARPFARFDRAARRARRPLLQRRRDLRRHADRRPAGFRPGRLSRHHGAHRRVCRCGSLMAAMAKVFRANACAQIARRYIEASEA